MNAIQKILSVAVAACLSFLMLAAPTPASAAPKIKITPQPFPEHSYQTLPQRLVLKEDFSFGVATHSIFSYHSSQRDQRQAGWAASGYELSFAWNESGYTGFSVSNKTVKGGYDMELVQQTAQQLDVPVWLLESGVIGHEMQHARDFTAYDLLDFTGLGKEFDDIDNSALKQRYAEITDCMEARAMEAELKAMSAAINSKIAEINAQIKKVDADIKTIKKLENKLSQHQKALNSGKTRNLLSDAELASVQAELRELQQRRISEDWDAQLLELKSQKNNLTDMKKNAEDIMLRTYGDATITASNTRYVDAYEKYIKNPAKGNKMSNNKNFQRVQNDNKHVIDAYLQACTQKLINNKNGSFYTVRIHIPKELRPVCRPCAMRDTWGRCPHPWCVNGLGRNHSEYKHQPGDYIPLNYQTLEPPFDLFKTLKKK